jgi:hypothetical protein
MERRINWLHLTDLHYGQRGQNILLPKIRKELFNDVEYIKDQIGKIDIVFFTGDLTQSGKQEEFNELTVFLKELWSHFKKLNSNPYLVAIPGNHDLNRPDPTKAAVKVLRNYDSDSELQEGLWDGLLKKNEYYDVIDQCFKNFTDWYKEINLPKPNLNYGLVPGDISAEILINDVKLKVVGLNTAFLELTSDNYVGKLAINPLQVTTLVGNAPVDWVEEADIALLLTHHDPKWYGKTSWDYYNNDINPGNLFYSHLCGHLHQANTSQSGLLGSELRRVQLAPSLFGLQKINNHLDRIHGYYAGSYILQDNNIKELFYPRKAIERYDGNIGIDADNGFNLGKKGFLELNRQLEEKPKTEIGKELNLTFNGNKKSFKDDDLDFTKENILDLKSPTVNIQELDKVPKTKYSLSPQHVNIRLVEQNHFVDLMKKDRLAWLITDWGLDENGFIGSVSNQLKIEHSKASFLLNCEDLATDDEIIAAVEEQFGMTLQRFCNLVTTIDSTLLVLDHVNNNLYSTINSFNRLAEILKSILDYCPSMHIVVVARQVPSFLFTEKYVKLTPLDDAQIQSYVEHHPGRTTELDDSDNLVKLIDITSGLPKHIDRIINSLRVTTFDELVEHERGNPSITILSDNFPKSIKQAIGLLAETNDRLKQRSLKLLKVLTVLSNGETFSNLTRFDSNEPIYLENANELERLSLLEIITTTKVLSKVASNPTQQIKIMRAPRQIRDYVTTLITENEKDDIIRLACDMYFGNKWREGSIKDIYGKSVLGASKFFNVDNCHLIINNLMTSAFKNDNEMAVERASLLAINFCNHVLDAGDYKNAIYTGEGIYNWLKSTDNNRSKATIAKMLGEAFRMLGNNEKSEFMLKEALEMEDANLSNDDKNSIYLELAYSYLKQLNFPKAIENAKEVEKTTSLKDGYGLQAKYIIARATLRDDALMSRLKSLQAQAKKESYFSLVNTISLYITSLVKDIKEREKRFNSILASKGDDYNKIRAIIRKSTDILEGDGRLSYDDLYLLNMSYSYLYTQRLQSLFTTCHKALWLFCIKEHRFEDLLNLFRHSSLVWRISGEIDLEKSYFQSLDTFIHSNISSVAKDSVINANVDYYDRRKLELSTQPLLN